MNNTEKATAIKNHLIQLVVNGQLDDMSQLEIQPIVDILDDNNGLDYDIAKAYQLLVPDNENSVEDMVRNIRYYEDDEELIDHVPGVTVWEKVENSFTCKDFLLEIKKR